MTASEVLIVAIIAAPVVVILWFIAISIVADIINSIKKDRHE